MLDFNDLNPISRVAGSNLKNLTGVKNDLLSHYPIFIAKKKEESKEEKPKKPAFGSAVAGTRT